MADEAELLYEVRDGIGRVTFKPPAGAQRDDVRDV